MILIVNIFGINGKVPRLYNELLIRKLVFSLKPTSYFVK